MDAAAEIARRIAERRGGKAKQAHEAWLKARAAGRFVLIESYVGKGRVRGWTWPDVTPGPAGPQPLAGQIGNGEYLKGQTAAQFTGIDIESLGCPCVAAVLILHEGHRLEQAVKDSAKTEAEEKAVVSNEQQMWTEDVNNINDVLASESCCGPCCTWCCVELYAMKGVAQAKIEQANKFAAERAMPQVPIPQ